MAVAQWEIIRHQAAIAGRVTNSQTGEQIGNALVEIIDGPAEFNDWLTLKKIRYGERWAYISERPGQTRTSANGHFHFLNLPSGEYTLRASIASLGKRYAIASTTTTVVRDTNGKVTLGNADMELVPTTIKGHITGPDGQGETKDILMAEVRIKRSGERAFSNEQGRYLLTAIEPGIREIAVSARGYETVTQSVALNEPGAEAEVNVALTLQT